MTHTCSLHSGSLREDTTTSQVTGVPFADVLTRIQWKQMLEETNNDVTRHEQHLKGLEHDAFLLRPRGVYETKKLFHVREDEG